MRKFWILLLVFPLTFAVRAQSTQPAAAASVVNAIKSVTALESSVGLYDKVELVADIDAVFTNPYDPDDIRVDGQFTSPSGKTVSVPGFYYRDYHYANGVLSTTTDWSWRLRFAPTEIGDWHYQVIATTAAGSKTSDTGTFSVTASDNPGFIRVDSRNPHYFAFDNGTPYFPVGEDMAWGTSSDPIADYQTWLDGLAGAGGNFARVWMAPWSFDIEWADTGLGNYDLRQVNAYQLDQVMDLMAQHHVYVMLSLLNHGQFSTTTDPEWDQNPFNAANGGPLAQPQDFASNPDALRLWDQRLRYIAARWGYSTNIFAWEWWNEINWTPLVNANILVPWLQHSAATLSALDPNHHLITHDGSPVADSTVWNLDSLAFTQNHQYNMTNLLTTFSQDIPNWLKHYPDKPFLMGEFGTPLTIDTQGLLVHQGLWSAPMNGSAGTGMTWWWDTYIQPNNLYYLFAGVAAFFHDEDLAAHQWQPASATFAEKKPPAIVYGLQADNYALLWVVSQNYNNSYFQNAYTRALDHALRQGQRHVTPVVDFPSVDNVSFSLNGLQSGSYTVEFWDTFAGKMTNTISADSTDGTLQLTLPSFTTDLAIKVKPQ